MEKQPVDPVAFLSGLTLAYTEAIRLSDFKANLMVLFAAIMMGPIVAYRDKYPPFLPLPLILLPFLIAFFFLLVCVYPRYPKRRGCAPNFLVVRNPTRADFEFHEGAEEESLAELKLRCSILSGILFIKTLCLQIAFAICFIAIVVIFALVIYTWL